MDLLFITQAVYRDLLEVMSRPGSIRPLTDKAGSFSSYGLLVIAVTLLDQEVSYHVVDNHELAKAIEETTGARLEAMEQADFIFVPTGDSSGRVTRAKRGTLEYPDHGATIVYQADFLSETGEDKTIELEGPGIENRAFPGISGIPREELLAISEMNHHYPLGIDTLLIDRDNRLMALPRSLQITL